MEMPLLLTGARHKSTIYHNHAPQASGEPHLTDCLPACLPACLPVVRPRWRIHPSKARHSTWPKRGGKRLSIDCLFYSFQREKKKAQSESCPTTEHRRAKVSVFPPCPRWKGGVSDPLPPSSVALGCFIPLACSSPSWLSTLCGILSSVAIPAPSLHSASNVFPSSASWRCPQGLDRQGPASPHPALRGVRDPPRAGLDRKAAV